MAYELSVVVNMCIIPGPTPHVEVTYGEIWYDIRILSLLKGNRKYVIVVDVPEFHLIITMIWILCIRYCNNVEFLHNSNPNKGKCGKKFQICLNAEYKISSLYYKVQYVTYIYSALFKPSGFWPLQILSTSYYIIFIKFLPVLSFMIFSFPYEKPVLCHIRNYLKMHEFHVCVRR